ncbi:NifU family protein [Vicingus serpentipes]|uniref:NifU family protein n=1 Tax=Vicingus serpentipes TaxID=1926625 RepID=A0A5C6RXL5_9FLAO|nr:NifU family protein [Vicingus serpentipes]TXB67316.1 NifU family protein [Vicingus serpentipes]
MEKTQAPYTIYAEMTPNPNSMKFVSNRWLVTNDRSYEILADQRVGGPSPLAEKLFSFPFINGVFIAGNFVSVTKNDAIEWQDVLLELRDFISEYLNSEGSVVIREEFLNAPEEASNETESGESNPTFSSKDYTDFEKKIAEILDEYIKPAVESDGGAIELDSFEDGVVKVILKGSCSGCPSSTMTLKHGIESMLKNMLPEVKEVEAING